MNAGREESLRRKDAIIRVRNAQISALWDEIHTKQPWRNALDQESMLDLPGDAQNASRALVVFGINTVSLWTFEAVGRYKIGYKCWNEKDWKQLEVFQGSLSLMNSLLGEIMLTDGPTERSD